MKLERLFISINNLTGGIPPSFGNLSSLKYFIAMYNNLVGNILDVVGQLKSLRLFAIGINKLSGIIPSFLYNVSFLQILSVPDSQLNGTLPLNIGLNLPNLQHLVVATNDFFRSIPASLCNATQFQYIDLGNNNFIGSVPTDLGNLLDLYWLRLGSNHLGRDFHFLTSLTNYNRLHHHVLDLDTNQFVGVLPNSISNLSTQLTSLYLAFNEISRTILASLRILST